MALPIEDYAVLGDAATAALVGRDGSIDWLCLPRFDSPACLAALVGSRDNGRWLLGPVEPAGPRRTTRGYLGDSFVLETTHETPTGVVRIIDFMPIGDGRADVVRRVEGSAGPYASAMSGWAGSVTARSAPGSPPPGSSHITR